MSSERARRRSSMPTISAEHAEQRERVSVLALVRRSDRSTSGHISRPHGSVLRRTVAGDVEREREQHQRESRGEDRSGSRPCRAAGRRAPTCTMYAVMVAAGSSGLKRQVRLHARRRPPRSWSRRRRARCPGCRPRRCRRAPPARRRFSAVWKRVGAHRVASPRAGSSAPRASRPR